MFTLTIKQKIALGFAAIGILLLAGSSFFYRSLNQIQTANNKIELVAVPVQNQSNDLQNTLLHIAKTSSLAFSQQAAKDISNSQSQFELLATQYRSNIDALANKVNSQAKMRQALASASEQYSQYQQQLNAMFAAKLATANGRDKFEQLATNFVNAKNNASNNMIDLEIMEVAPEDIALLDEVIGTGIRIDDMLFTLGNTINELSRLTDKTTLDSHQQDVAVLLGNLKTYSQYLHQQASPLAIDELLKQYDTNLAVILSMVDEQGRLYQAQTEVINQLSLAERNYQAANQTFEQVNGQLEQLVTLAKGHFSELQSDASDVIDTSKSLAIVMAVGFIVLASLIYFFTSKAMLGPLAAVNKALSRIASGDLSRRIKKRNNDEFGELMDNINKLADDLTLLLKQIDRDAHLLDDAANDSRQQGQALAEAATAQIDKIATAKQLAEEIHRSSDQVNQQAGDASEQIHLASEQGAQVKGIAVSNKQRIEQLSSKLQDSVTIMANLSQHSNDIGGILVTISSIAEQTNLLALNAAIEAARAGEHGRGFAVVADEVRGLASRTQASTAEIQTMITALQKETELAADTIESGQQQATECVSQSQSLNDAVEHIENALQTINSMSSEIALAAETQLDFSNQIEHTMNESSTTTENNAEASQSMASQSLELNELAKSLTTSVERFKL
ncbi:methyl-accepting chemotaxis protein [Shewanella maritima]|uniref:Methyl-accepting chemotaxis protein n=1 Tax=Shewanella maritima TaxID=2520507 RepID=A0A411PKI3_9GAMM|nr:methyl-accepting chemotaxis protein [Shewanella maritima]QBF84024.1 methyl-accepting chemotaxis protein [Shewanella maritima]